MLALLSIDPHTRESERALYIAAALITFSLSIFFWLKQIEFIDEYVEEYEFLSFPLAEKEEPAAPSQAQPQPPKPQPVKLWCAHCGSTRILMRGKRIYCLDCGQITRIAREQVKAA
jgi:molybdenum cofactor biosynthesis enzyme MoaA